MIKQVQMY